MKRLAAMAIVVAVFGAGCGGDDDGDDRAATLSDTSSTAASEEAASAGDASAADLEAKLLTVGDLPPGYSAMPDEADDEDDGTDDFCPEASEYFERFEDAGDDVDVEAQFQKGEPGLAGGAFLFQSLGTGDSDELAGMFDALPEAFELCREFTTTDENGTFTGHFEPLSFTTHGDQTFAMHLSGEVGSPEFSFPMAGDMVFVRKGSVVTMVFTFGFGSVTIPVDELDQIVATATTKL